jgi:hypothetical protein
MRQSLFEEEAVVTPEAKLLAQAMSSHISPMLAYILPAVALLVAIVALVLALLK